MTNIIDLTGKEFQGSYGDDICKGIDKVGEGCIYKVRLVWYDVDTDIEPVGDDPNEAYINMTVEILAHGLYDDGTTQEIIGRVIDGKPRDIGKTYSFYYNGAEGNFKYFGEYIADDYPEIEVERDE